MMNGMNDGWGMGYGYGWIIVLIVIVAVVWLVIKALNKNKK
jgi:putative membrane protein